MKRGSIWSIALAAALTLACGDGRDNDVNDNTIGDATVTRPADNTAATAGDRDSAMANVPGTDANFVQNVAADSMAEVKLGQLAAERAANAEVKKFAQRMVTDHTKASGELKPIATKLNVQIPTEMDDEHQDLHDRLSKLTGAEFDREYINAMVEGHEDVLNQLERKANDKVGSRSVGTAGEGNRNAAGNDADDAAVTEWASKTLPTVREHLAQARQLQQKLGNR